MGGRLLILHANDGLDVLGGCVIKRPVVRSHEKAVHGCQGCRGVPDAEEAKRGGRGGGKDGGGEI